ncbi:hypothetical protein UlMin_039131 [Ulmus minor]
MDLSISWYEDEPPELEIEERTQFFFFFFFFFGEGAEEEIENNNDEIPGDAIETEEKEEQAPKGCPQKTYKFMTKYERARILGSQICSLVCNMNAPVMVELEGEIDPLELILQQRKTILKSHEWGAPPSAAPIRLLRRPWGVFRPSIWSISSKSPRI